jgi:basic membrane lipoprotein Med (substrate-binding protein (PBP1-ABC) superfamily)
MSKQVRQVSQARPTQAARTGRASALGRATLAWLRTLRGRTIALTAGALAAAAALAVTAVLLFSHDDRPPLPDARARAYTDVDACLLTGERGVTAGTTAATVWQGMQDASAKTHARVSYAQVTGEQSTGNARPFLNGLLQRSCDVVLAVGGPEVTAAEETAPQYKQVDFVLVGGAHTGANVTAVGAGDGLRADVAEAVERTTDASH